ncbi:hypothetical protein CBOM_04526 [Ceraceosorus bombacis]|uniref:Uncharacterized protein n=1 Tax=Ceraceosorus bombacis TaxID=401625 RepID=A0A0P1BQM4_9BASI|nr:hypothetical protein CBOM_04526 [Ceraceosorus bombacis]
MPPSTEAGPSRATSDAASHDSTTFSSTSSFRKPSSGNRLVVEVETRSSTPTSSKSSTGSSSSAGRVAPAAPASAANAYTPRNAQRDDSSSSSAKRPSSLKSYLISAASTSSPKSSAPAAVAKRQTSDLAVVVASPPRRDSPNRSYPSGSGDTSSASPIKPNAARIGAPSSLSLRNPNRDYDGQSASGPASANSEGNNDTKATSKFQQARLRQAESSSPSPAAAAGRHKPLVIEKKQPAGLSRHLLPPKPRSSLLSPVTPATHKAPKPQPARSLLEEAKARAAKRHEYTKARTAGRTSADYVPPPTTELPRSEFGEEARIWGSPFREPRAGNSGDHRGTRLLRCQWDVDRSTHFEHNHVQCGKTFSTAEALIRHVCRAHIDLVSLPPREVKMSCQWKGCANRRFDKTTLKGEHLRGHLAAAAFECPFKECRLSNGVELTDYKAQDQHIRLEHQDFRDDSELRPLLWVAHLPGSAALEQHKKKLRAIAACIKNLPGPTPWWKAEIAIPLSSEPPSKPAPKVDDTLQSLSMETGNVKTLATQASAVLPATQVDESSEPPGPRPWNSVKLEAVEIDASRLGSSELYSRPLAVAGSKEAPFSLDDDASNSSSSTLPASPLHLFKRPRTSADQPPRTGQPTPRPHVSSFIGHSGTISDGALDAERPASQPRPSAPPTGARHALGQGRREPRQYMPNPIEVLQQAQRAKES